MSNGNTIGERIYQLMKHYGLNKNSLTVKLGTSSNSVIGRIVNDPDRAPSYDILKEILIKHPNVNARWLVTGEGDILGKEVTAIEKGEIRYFELLAGGCFNVDILGKATAILTIYGYNDCEIAFNVFGDSMSPRFKSGDIILCSGPIDEAKLFGEPYFIVTKSSVMIRTIKSHGELTYRLSAENARFEDQDMNKNDITQIFPIKGLIRREVF